MDTVDTTRVDTVHSCLTEEEIETNTDIQDGVPKRGNNLPKVTQLINGKVRI